MESLKIGHEKTIIEMDKFCMFKNEEVQQLLKKIDVFELKERMHQALMKKTMAEQKKLIDE